MNIKTCFFCQTGVAFKPITNARGEILTTHSICRNPSCPSYQKDLTKLALRRKKSSLSSKRTFKTSKPKSRLLKGMLVTLVSAALSYSSFTALAQSDFTNSTEIYQQTASSTYTSTQKNVLSEQKEPVQKTTTTETIKEKIQKYALKYDVDPRELENIVKCEADTDDVNKASTTIQSHYLEGTPRREKSFGIVQIHISKVAVSYDEAVNPDFALDYLAKNWKAGNQWMWKICSVKYGYL